MDRFGKLIDPQTVVFERVLPGPMERVFDYLWNEEKRRLWFTSGGMPTAPGETFQMHWKHSEYSPHKSPAPEAMKEMDEKGHSSTNTLLAYEPPTRLAFTFGEAKFGADKAATVEFLLKPEGDPKDNKVRLILTHSRLPDRPYMLGISGGWHSHLDILEYQLKAEVPPGFWDVWRRYDGVYATRYAGA
jgi:uncharacterized protein YndB with AHSA1/START domain